MSLVLPRRKFLVGLGSLVAAPAIVRASSLMPIKVLVDGRLNLFVDHNIVVPWRRQDGSRARPWATLQQAMDYIGNNLDLRDQPVTVNIGHGSYQGATLKGDNRAMVEILGAGAEDTFIMPAPSEGWCIGGLQAGDAIDRMALVGAPSAAPVLEVVVGDEDD